ncbi:MAG TPA: tetratricopeptide repeat protein, partial [Chthonomonadaceae bacterium]|nr:tetratricopeptide repeat protein [Chthonomonadaceae bacterium]
TGLQVANTGGSGSTPAAASGSEGVNCVTCHATVAVERTGNGHLTLEAPQNYPFAAQERGWQRALHDFLIRVRPGPHQRTYLKPALHTSAEFCGGCHRQSFSVAQNRYQFVRGPDEYGEWQSGALSGRVARSASLLATSAHTCQECHFPQDESGHVSHAALGANTALPALRGDLSRVAATEAFLRQNAPTLDLFCLRRTAQGSEAREDWFAPLEMLSPADGLRPGEMVLLDIVVSTRSVGHSFPAGYEDLKDAWLEVTLSDAQGRILLGSGVLTSETESVPTDAHAWRMIPLDRFGHPIVHHDLTEQVTMAYRHAIAPGSSDIARYRMTVPATDASGQPLHGPLRLRARLRYRHLRPNFVCWMAGKDPPPALPITTLAEASTLLPVQSGSAAATAASLLPTKSDISLSQRYLDYGIGLLAPREGPKLPDALRAFQKAYELAPDRIEPLLGAARAYLREPDLPSARAKLEQALRMAPDNGAIPAELGVVYRRQGEYDRALALLRPLAARFPQDGALQFDLGLTLVNLSDFENAVKAFQHALDADPDDAAAHYQLMRCWQHLKRIPEERREETIGHYLAEDKMAPRLLPNYLRDHPEDRQATQPIPEHTLHPM